MAEVVKPIRPSRHAQEHQPLRGFTVEQVEAAIRRSRWGAAESGRLQFRMSFAYRATWRGRRYETIQVRPVFVELPEEIVVVTVYTYFS